ncbi:S8 family serine peptidase [Geomonas oryzisoli]|uniref:S8 family serine peptidase n=1 Tax=Geomonas oryzisoli TaxID=2847992 RepID=A0ABX8JC25_9BACT|nr:S8 family serine peptidase [Geomonas oryzisoli]QWV94239.1 S8 family serine peptidase [Geomonas oryzisoli]
MCRQKVLAWLLALSMAAVAGPQGTICWAKDSVKHEVKVNGLIVGDAGDAAAAAELRGRSEQGVRLWVVQFAGPVAEQEKEAVARLGVRLLDYLPEFAFLAAMDDAARRQVQALSFIDGVTRFHPGYKMNGKLRKLALQPASGETVTLQLKLDAPASLANVLAELRRQGAALLEVGRDTVRVRAESGAIAGIAALEEVTWIGEHVDMELLNDTARWVIQSNEPGRLAIWDKGIRGEGEIVGVGDSGLDHDIPWIRDPTGAPIGSTHRKLAGYDTTYGDDYDADYPGHGTHVCGTLAGDRTPVDGLDTANGMAPKAKLFLQDLTYGASNSVYPPDDLGILFDRAQQAGARLHSDSWGNTDRSYSLFTQSADRYLWDHKDFMMLVANGNSGPTRSTVGNPANAKNVISVGASYNGSNAQNLASFSSRGPTADGRIKPTLTAPGVGLISADSDGLKNSFNSGTLAMSGTSMATPTVAGAAALVRQYFSQGYYPLGVPTPANALFASGALVKAVLINSAQEMTGTGTDGPIPSTGQGWGRVQLDRVLPFAVDAGRLAVVADEPGLATGATWSRDFAVAGSEPFKATLVWTDYPGVMGAARALVNDLDLTVTAPDGTPYAGNVFANGASVPGGAADRLNVEEQVLIKAPMAGMYTVTVSGYNVPSGPQPFALAITGVMGASQRGTLTLDRKSYNSGASLQIRLVDTGLNRDHQVAEQVEIKVASTGEAVGEAVSLRETSTDSAVFTGTLPLAPLPAVPGDGILQVDGSDTVIASYQDADDGTGKTAVVTASAVVENVPPVCSGLTATGATETTATVLWRTDEPAGTLLEYGLTPALGARVADQRLMMQHEMQLAALKEGSRYYVTVTATDEAGNSSACSTSFATLNLPPSLLVMSAAGSVSYDSTTVISGLSTDPSGVASVTVNGTAASYRVSDGYFELELPLSLGDNLFNVVASDTLGNSASRQVTVTRLEAGDVLVQSVSGPAAGQQGGAITVTDTVCNNGPGAAPSFNVGFLLSADAAYSADDRFIGSRSVSALLPAGNCVSASSEITIPASVPGGTFYLVACADYGKAVEETDETNNCRVGTVLALPELFIPPPAVINVPANNSTGTFPVSWGASSVSGVTYILEYSWNGGAWTRIYSGTGTYTYPSVTQDGSYGFRVKAVKSGYADSPYTTSSTTCAVRLACGAPATVTVPATNSTGQIPVSWGSSNISGATYVLEQRQDEGAWTELSRGSAVYAYPKVTQNGNYGFRVKAVKTGYADSPYTTSAITCAVNLACGAPGAVNVPATNSTGQLSVSWGSSNISGVTYVLEVRQDEGAWAELSRGTAVYSYPVVTQNGSYGFRVKAVKTGYADSPYTTAAITCAVNLACGAPGAVNVPATNSTGQLSVSWGSSNISGATYVLEQRLDEGAWTELSRGSAVYAYPKVTQNGNYSFRVKAVKSGYTDSPYTTSAACAVNLACGAPGAVNVPATNSTGQLSVSWGSSNISGATYVLEQRLDEGAWTELSRGSAVYAYPKVTQNGNYSFRVKAVKAGYADSPYTTSAACAVNLACGAPGAVRIPGTNSTGQFQVSWGSSNVSGVTYVLEARLDDGPWSEVSRGTGTYVYQTVAVNGSYLYRVKAIKTGFADSPYTTSAAPCKVYLVCGAPAALNVPSANSTGQFQVSWVSGNVSGATYVLEYRLNDGPWTEMSRGTGTYTYPKVTVDGSYWFRVKAVKAGFDDSPYTVSANACVVKLVCGAPASITVPAASSTGKFQVSWGSSNVSGVTYQVEYSRDGGAWTQLYSGGGTYTYFSASSSGSYSFRVKAMKSGYAESGYTTSPAPCIVTLN